MNKGLAFLEIKNGWSENNWINKYNSSIISASWLEKSMYSFYWSSTTMITVGYGDITPSNVYEAIFVTVAMYFGCGFFSYLLSYI